MTSESCGYCGTSLLEDRLSVPEAMFDTGECFDYSACSGCGSLSLIDVPDDITSYYPANYYSIDQDPEALLGRGSMRKKSALLAKAVLWGPGSSGLIAVRALRNLEALRIAHELNSVRRSGLRNRKDTSILDVGAGSGILVFLLGLGGLRNVTGVDPFIAVDKVLSTGGRLFKASLHDLNSKYDVVMFHHSFEHVPHVEIELKAAVARLNPGGRVLIRMPTVSSEAYESYGTSWFQLDAPRHFTVASRAGMDRLCARVGLRVVSVTDDSSGIQFWRSEQVRTGLPIQGPRLQRTTTTTTRAQFTRVQLADWEKRARYLNKINRGDQAAWILERF